MLRTATRKVHLVTFDHEVFRLNLYILNNNVVIHKITKILQEFLVNDIEVQGASPTFQKYVTKHMKPFCRSALQYYIVMGFCIYKVSTKKIDGKMQPVPIVLNPHFYDIYLEYYYTTGRHKFMICERGETKPLSNVFVSVFGSEDELVNEFLNSSPSMSSIFILIF